jgi:hypothetical protein
MDEDVIERKNGEIPLSIMRAAFFVGDQLAEMSPPLGEVVALMTRDYRYCSLAPRLWFK